MRVSPWLLLLLLALPGVTALAAPTPGTGSDVVAKDWQILHPPAAPRPYEFSDKATPPPDGPAAPSIQDGIGPGSALQQCSEPGGNSCYICTAGFLLRDPATAKYYLSTAGHCLVQDEEDPGAYAGKTEPDKLMPELFICRSGCIDNALGFGDYERLVVAGPYNPVLFAQSGGVGLDFGVIELPPGLHEYLRPWMPQWSGPTGYQPAKSGDLLVHFGHGSYCCPLIGAVASRTPADQGRTGVSLGDGGDSFTGAGYITGGDSGSAISRGSSDAGRGIKGTEAVGILTHSLGIEVSLPEFLGTTLAQGLAMVRGKTGLSLELVLQDDALTTVPAVTYSLTMQGPAPGARLEAPADVKVHGVAASSQDALPAGAKVQVAVDDPGFAHPLAVKGTESWEATWRIDARSGGMHTIRARLVDAAGATLAQANATVQVATSTGGTEAPSTRAPTPTADPGEVQVEDGGEAVDEAPQDEQPQDLSAPERQAPGPTTILVLAILGLAVASRRRR